MEPEGAIVTRDEEVFDLSGPSGEDDLRGIFIEEPRHHLKEADGVGVAIGGAVVVVLASLPVIVVDLNEGPIDLVFWLFIDDPTPDFFLLVGDDET